MTLNLAKDLERALRAIQGYAGSLEAGIDTTLRAISAATPSPLRAINYDPTGRGPEPWCELHEQPITACRKQEHNCDGTPILGGDPTGEAAINGAATTHPDRQQLRSAIDRAYRAIYEAESIRRHWQKHTPGLTATYKGLDDDDLWCRSCWRDNKHCEPISDNYRGQHLCRWCGDYAGANKGQRPPVALLAKRHRGERITQRDIDEATHHHTNA